MKGEVLIFKTDAVGDIIPNSIIRSENTLQPHLKTYCASGLWDSSVITTYKMDDLFTANGYDADFNETWFGTNGRDGIFLCPSAEYNNSVTPYDLTVDSYSASGGSLFSESYALITTVNAGGTNDGGNNYIEYKGTYTGTTLGTDGSDGVLHLGRGFSYVGGTTSAIDNLWATKSGISLSLSSSETLYVYWKITFGS